jgi:hypothetical protein
VPSDSSQTLVKANSGTCQHRLITGKRQQVGTLISIVGKQQPSSDLRTMLTTTLASTCVELAH